MMKHFLLFILILIFFSSCEKEVLEDVESTHGVLFCENYDFADDKIYIRLLNMSAIDFDSSILDHQYHFGFLAAGEYSCTMQMDSVLLSPYAVDIFADSQFSGGISCGVGVVLPLLTPGYYTYPIYVIRDIGGRMNFGVSAYEIRDPKILFNPSLGNCVLTNETECDYQLDQVNVRVVNFSAFDYCDFKLISSEGNEVNFGNVIAGDTTCYVSFETVEDYLYESKFSIGQKNFTISKDNLYYNKEMVPGNYVFSTVLENFDEVNITGKLTLER